MAKLKKNTDNEHTTIFNGLLYKGDSSEAFEFRRMNEVLKERNQDLSWKTKTPEERILLKKRKSEWAARVQNMDVKARPRF